MPQHKTIRKRLSPKERAEQLMSTALQLFAQQGLGRVGHGDIAKRAGVTTGTVFNYFPTIEALNSAVMDYVRGRSLEIFERPVPPNNEEPEILIFGARLLDMAESQPECFKIFLNWSYAFGDPFRARFLAIKDEILSHIEQVLPDGNHLDVDAKIIFGTGVLLAQMKLEGAPEAELHRFAARVAQLVG